MSDLKVYEIIAEIKKLFENNKRARVIQIKHEAMILEKIDQLLNQQVSKQSV